MTNATPFSSQWLTWTPGPSDTSGTVTHKGISRETPPGTEVPEVPKAPAHDKRIVGIVSASPGGVAHEKMTTQGTDNADNAFPMTRITSRSRQEKRRKIIPSGPTENDLLLTEACAEFEA